MVERPAAEILADLQTPDRCAVGPRKSRGRQHISLRRSGTDQGRHWWWFLPWVIHAKPYSRRRRSVRFYPIFRPYTCASARCVSRMFVPLINTDCAQIPTHLVIDSSDTTVPLVKGPAHA